MLENKEILLIILIICVIFIFVITLKKCAYNLTGGIYRKLVDFKDSIIDDSSAQFGELINDTIDKAKNKISGEYKKLDKQKIRNKINDKVNKTIDDRINKRIEEYERQHQIPDPEDKPYEYEESESDEETEKPDLMANGIDDSFTDKRNIKDRVKNIINLVKPKKDIIGYTADDSHYYYL